MKSDAVIFDMDGLLIDSEPFWEEAGIELLKEFNIHLTAEQYYSSTGLRTDEWVAHWFSFFKIDKQHAENAVTGIIDKAINKIEKYGVAMPGVPEIFSFFKKRGFKMAIATSSPIKLADIVADKLNIREYLDCIVSAENLEYGKPHPEVYLDCAMQLGVAPVQCICFEDSFNGMVAVKAARMKCVVIPLASSYHLEKWGAADMKLQSLAQFGEEQLNMLMK
ncbi:MAG: hexitol phosphatase HxpB [Chitinophagaceae bacterium]|nr:hexitol phosphatase HxpB [Chitinophagaceae bacterium]